MPNKYIDLEKQLEEFVRGHNISGKGPLSVMLVLTRRASELTPPFTTDNFLTASGGQVKGLGGPAVQAILADHGVSRILAEEGGRTSRGSIDRMHNYVQFLNKLHQTRLLDFSLIEEWWVNRVKEFFSSQPLKVKMDSSKSLRYLISELVKAAYERQSECPGTMVVGAVIQHLVGAKLTIALPHAEVKHEGFSVADSPGKRKGDFLINDTAIHVTTAPTESLLRKCQSNLDESIRPVIVTTESGAGGARALATNYGIEDRLDILEVEQFVATNIYEWCGFEQQQRPLSIGELLKEYNRIIDLCETDPSLKIAVD